MAQALPNISPIQPRSMWGRWGVGKSPCTLSTTATNPSPSGLDQPSSKARTAVKARARSMSTRGKRYLRVRCRNDTTSTTVTAPIAMARNFTGPPSVKVSQRRWSRW